MEAMPKPGGSNLGLTQGLVGSTTQAHAAVCGCHLTPHLVLFPLGLSHFPHLSPIRGPLRPLPDLMLWPAPSEQLAHVGLAKAGFACEGADADVGCAGLDDGGRWHR